MLKEIFVPLLRFLHIFSSSVVFGAAWYEFIFLSDRTSAYYPLFWTSLVIAALSGGIVYLWQYRVDNIFEKDDARLYQLMLRVKWILFFVLAVLGIVLKVENWSVPSAFITLGIVCLSSAMNLYRGWHSKIEEGIEMYEKQQDVQPREESINN